MSRKRGFGGESLNSAGVDGSASTSRSPTQSSVDDAFVVPGSASSWTCRRRAPGVTACDGGCDTGSGASVTPSHREDCCETGFECSPPRHSATSYIRTQRTHPPTLTLRRTRATEQRKTRSTKYRQCKTRLARNEAKIIPATANSLPGRV